MFWENNVLIVFLFHRVTLETAENNLILQGSVSGMRKAFGVRGRSSISAIPLNSCVVQSKFPIPFELSFLTTK